MFISISLKSLTYTFPMPLGKENLPFSLTTIIRHLVALTCSSTRYSIVGVSAFFNFKEGFINASGG